MTRLAFTLALAVLAGCGDAPGRLLVDLQTDLVAGVEMDQVRTTVSGQPPVLHEVPAGDDYAAGRRVADLSIEGPVVVTVEALKDGVSLLDAGASLDVRGTTGVTVTISRACRGLRCPGVGDSPDATECRSGRCVTAACAAEPLACEDACQSAADCPAGAACTTPRCEQGVCLSVSACAAGESCDDERGCVAEETALSFDDLLGVLARASCETLAACYGSYLEIFVATENGASCEALQGDIFRRAVAPLFERAFDEGTLVYDPSNAQACIDRFLERECALIDASAPLDCLSTFRGQVPLDAACGFDFECAGAARCDLDDGCPGRCRPLVESGGACSRSSVCAAGLRCASGTCEPPPPDGVACDDEHDCAPGSVCLGPDGGESTCRAVASIPVAGVGERCDVVMGPACAPGLSCAIVGVGDVRCVEPVAEGASCFDGIPAMCLPDLACSADPFAPGPLEGTCGPLPDEGQPCAPREAQRCRSGHACVAGSCVRLRDVGESCGRDDECFAFLECAGGRCALPPPCSTLQ